MRRQDVIVLNIGGDQHFQKSINAVEWLLSSHSVSVPRPRTQFVTATDLQLVTETTLIPCTLMHVMGHGDRQGGIGGSRQSKMFWVENLIPYCENDNNEWFPDVDVLLLDACSTFSPSWMRSLGALQPRAHEMLFIGTTRAVTWHEATTYASAFYSAIVYPAFPRNRTARQRRAAAQVAHEKASLAFLAVLGKPSPFRSTTVASTR